MPASRMSFRETPNWRDLLGFINRLGFIINAGSSPPSVTARAGGLVYGFRQGNRTIGRVLDHDVTVNIPIIPMQTSSVFYITMDADGTLRVENGVWTNVRGIAGGPADIPWYTFNGRALVGKVFGNYGIPQGVVTCDDAFWCEFEGVFP